ncbi:MAG: phenylacetate--CoA ligase family protein [Coriobacteriales bacterium]|nr:phenylacetate--CoA ligase family protein [Coriobacteriales bacterium]
MIREELILSRLNRIITYAKGNSSFYAEHLASVGSLTSLDELAGLPFVQVEDMRSHPARLLCTSITKVARPFSHFTTGTLGRPKRIFFSQRDVDDIVARMRDIILTSLEGVDLSDPAAVKVGIYLPDNGRLSMAEMIRLACVELGLAAYKGSCMDETEDQLAEIERERPCMIMGSAFRIWRVTQVGRERGGLVDLGVQRVFITSEYLSSTMRRRLERTWGAQVYHHYGMTEPGFAIGIECSCHDGFHYDDTQLYFEVVDPDTGQVLPDGQQGELVFTSLVREAMPLIRYRTGDIAHITHEPCACGRETPRIGVMPKKLGLIYTLDDGREVYASMYDEILYDIDDLLDYRIHLLPDGILCQAEQIGDAPDFADRVSRALGGARVEVMPRKSLRRGGTSLKRKIVDHREGQEDWE